MSACFTPSNSTDVLVLVSDGVLSLDGSVIADGSTASGDSNGNGVDSEGGGGAGDATMGTNDGALGSGDGSAPDGPVSMPDATGGNSDASDGGSTVVPNSCPSAQTQFGNTAQGDANPNFTSGVGVRTATSLLIFSGYAGPDPDAGAPSDGGDAGTVNVVYVQAFDPTTANPLGPARPLFTAPPGSGLVVESASIAPTGEIALAFRYGGPWGYADPNNNNSTRTSLYAAFLETTADAGSPGVTLQKAPVQLESATVFGQPHVAWSVATGAFVFSWQYNLGGGVGSGPYFLAIKSFRRNGQAAGGTSPVPTDQPSATVFDYYDRNEQGSVAAGPNLFGVAFQQTNTNNPSLTILDLSGNQVGGSVPIASGNHNWVTVGATAQGFVYLYDNGSSVAEAFVPTSADAGAVVSDAGLSGFTFTGAIGAYEAHAINDDTGGLGGVGVALLYSNGLSFAYVNADGVAHVGPLSVIAHTYAAYDQVNITNFGGSFGLSLYSAATQSTQMAASGCQ